ncbi:hypothetical protein VE02_02540 [Pseudogymnoascus sp. 03VT05]|nr:hypothetical protein VE02_02540 [Pseudogymnoascus sp. 03VT05]
MSRQISQPGNKSRQIPESAAKEAKFILLILRQHCKSVQYALRVGEGDGRAYIRQQPLALREVCRINRAQIDALIEKNQAAEKAAVAHETFAQDILEDIGKLVGAINTDEGPRWEGVGI